MLCYVGGFTRILSVDRSISSAELMMAKLVEFCGLSVLLRCQLPNCELVEIKFDEDLANLVEEYEKASSSSPQKIRVVLSSQDSQKVVSPPTSSASSVDSSGYNSQAHVTGDRSCFHFQSRLPSPPIGVNVRVGELRCYPCDDEPRVAS